jgi:hypothetical protein
MPPAPTFYVVPGSTVKRVIDDNKKQVFDAVEAAYRLHGSGNTLNPDSYFLRYPDRPSARMRCSASSPSSADRARTNTFRLTDGWRDLDATEAKRRTFAGIPAVAETARKAARGATHTVAAAYVVGSRYLKRRAENG